MSLYARPTSDGHYHREKQRRRRKDVENARRGEVPIGAITELTDEEVRYFAKGRGGMTDPLKYLKCGIPHKGEPFAHRISRRIATL